MKKSLILLGFLFLCPGVFATEPTPTETNSLIVAYHLLDDSWIRDVGALTNDWARIYKDSLSTNQPPSYGAYVVNGNSWEFTSFSQRELWDYLYNTPYSNGVNWFRSYIQTDELGEYITVGRLASVSTGGRIESTSSSNLLMPIQDMTVSRNAARLATLSTVQTEEEIELVSNAVCNCDWQIVTNIFNCVYAISNTLDSVEYNTYHSMTNTEAILDALYSNWQGQNISLADWTRYIWVYLTTNNSGKPLKDLLYDLNYSITNFNNVVSNYYDSTMWYTTNTWNSFILPWAMNSITSRQIINSFNEQFGNFYDGDYSIDSFLTQLNFGNFWTPDGYQGAYNTSRGLLTALNSIYGNSNYQVIFEGLNNQILSNAYNIVTNKTEGVVYGVILPELSNVQNEPNIYSALTNAYLNSYSQQSDLTWLDRVELLLAALVFPDTSATNTVEDADTAQSASEQTAQQFSDQLGQVTSALISGNPSQDFQTTTGHLSTLLTTFRQHMVIQKPQAILIPSIDEPFEWIGGNPTDGPFIDTQNSTLGEFVDFLRNIFSLCWVAGFFVMAYKSILLIFRIYAAVYNFSQALFRRILS